MPLRRFRYDARRDILKRPKGRVLRPQHRVEHGRFFYSRASDCSRCSMRGDCLFKGCVIKAMVLSDSHPALLRARRRKERWSKARRSPLPTPPMAPGRVPWRGDDLARPGQDGAVRLGERAHPGILDGCGRQPKTPRGSPARPRVRLAERRTWSDRGDGCLPRRSPIHLHRPRATTPTPLHRGFNSPLWHESKRLAPVHACPPPSNGFSRDCHTIIALAVRI